MRLTLYHNDKEPQHVYNVIKVSVDDFRTVNARLKHGVEITYRVFYIDQDYQRLIVELD